MNIKVFFVFILSFTVQVACADTRAVMLFLSGRDQPDTLGYNLVKELPALLYEEIAGGSVPLWDSPAKKVRIQPASLKSLEQSNGVSFVKAPQLFILEKWTLDNEYLGTEISGFYFTDRTAAGKELSYGFVDYTDAELVLTSESIQANADGSCFATFKYILLNHLYFYNIVQFGNDKISDLAESEKLKNKYQPRLSADLQPLQLSKKITWIVERKAGSASDETKKAVLLLDAVEDFFNDNKEEYFNLGGNRYSDFAGRDTVHIVAIEAEEIWTRRDTGFDTQLLSLVLVTDHGSLTPLAPEDVWKLGISNGSATLSTALKQKEFYFRILAINADIIVPEESAKYRKALQAYAWNRIREFVRYE